MWGKLEEFPISKLTPGWFTHSGSAGADFGPWWVTRSNEGSDPESKAGAENWLENARNNLRKTTFLVRSDCSFPYNL